MQTNNPIIDQFHEAYSKATLFRLPLNSDRRYWWEKLEARGVTLSDLKLVIRYLQFQIAKGERHDGCLRFSNLVGWSNRFDEELELAKAWERNRPPPRTVKDRYVTKPLDTSKSVSQVMAGSRDISELVRKAHEAVEKGDAA